MINSKKVTISLLLYNSAKYLPFCLLSLFNQTFQDWKLVILDNHSPDDSLEIAKKLCVDKNNVKFLTSDKNLGFTSGHNLIMRQVDGEYIMLLNPDTILEQDYLEKIVNFLEEHNDAGAVSGKILRYSFNSQEKLTNTRKSRNIDTAGLQLHKSFQTTDLGSGQIDKGQYNNDQEVFGVSGCLSIYRRQAIAEVNYFDKLFFSYKEDVDLAFRMQAKEWKAYRVGSAVAYHDRTLNETEDRKKRSSFLNYLSYRNHLYVLIKNLSLADFLRYGVFITWYEFKKIIYLMLFEQKTLLAWLEVIKFLPKLIQKRREIKPRSIKSWIK
ncbi:MAG: glycosyltransferase family 2 protein [Candidatus Falkowbacteria bacterium]